MSNLFDLWSLNGFLKIYIEKKTGHLTMQEILEDIHQNNQRNDGSECENSPKTPKSYHEHKDVSDNLMSCATN